MVWPLSGLLAHCQVCGAASMGSGVLAGVDPQGAQGQEGQAQLAYPSVICFGRGPDALGGNQSASRGMDPQKHSVGCLRGASKFPVRNWFPLGFWLGDG